MVLKSAVPTHRMFLNVVVVVVVDIFYLQHMISYRKYVIKKEALESNHTGVISLFP